MKIGLLPQGDDLAAAVRVFFDIIDQLIHEIIALYGRSVSLADRSVAYIPRIPPCDTHLLHFGKDIGRVLIYSEYLPDAGLPCLAAECAYRELTLRQVVFAHHVIDADSVRRSSVLILRARILILVSVIEDVVYIIYKISVCLGHLNSPVRYLITV